MIGINEYKYIYDRYCKTRGLLDCFELWDCYRNESFSNIEKTIKSQIKKEITDALPSFEALINILELNDNKKLIKRVSKANFQFNYMIVKRSAQLCDIDKNVIDKDLVWDHSRCNYGIQCKNCWHKYNGEIAVLLQYNNKYVWNITIPDILKDFEDYTYDNDDDVNCEINFKFWKEQIQKDFISIYSICDKNAYTYVPISEVLEWCHKYKRILHDCYQMMCTTENFNKYNKLCKCYEGLHLHCTVIPSLESLIPF